MTDPAPSVIPNEIVVERDDALRVRFSDGVDCRFPVLTLRAACPCASCRGWRERGEAAWPRPGAPATTSIVDAQLVGAWGISLRWSDGHDTGIYAWAPLRRWWDEGLAEGLAEDPTP